MCQFYYDCVGYTVQHYTGLPYLVKVRVNYVTMNQNQQTDQSTERGTNQNEQLSTKQQQTIY
jgi:hypothetical protein